MGPRGFKTFTEERPAEFYDPISFVELKSKRLLIDAASLRGSAGALLPSAFVANALPRDLVRDMLTLYMGSHQENTINGLEQMIGRLQEAGAEVSSTTFLLPEDCSLIKLTDGFSFVYPKLGHRSPG